ncbi:MAG: glycosyltransferase family 4 protein [Pseudomonadota bacterium]
MFTRSYLPAIGGREIVVYYLARAYQQLGYKVCVVGRLGISKRKLWPSDVPVHPWPSLVTPLTKVRVLRGIVDAIQMFELYLMIILEKIIWGADVVHAHATFPQGYAASKVTRLLRKTVLVITPHGNDIHTIPEIGHGMGLDPEIAKRIKRALESADLVTSIADGITSSILKYGIDKSKIASIPNGVDTERFASVAKITREITEDGEVRLLSIGNFNVRKGHRELIDAVATLNEQGMRCSLTIVGVTNSDLVDYVKENGIPCHFAGRIQFTPGAGNAEDKLVEILGQSHLYVSAAIDAEAEGMSLAVLEAMAAGLPILATDVSGNRDLINTFENGLLVAPNDVGSLAQGIRDMVSDRHDFDRKRENSIRGAAKLSWQAVAQQYVDAIDALNH